jgi:hypothetical protein
MTKRRRSCRGRGRSHGSSNTSRENPRLQLDAGGGVPRRDDRAVLPPGQHGAACVPEPLRSIRSCPSR